jgi:hypothetical protein
MKINELLEMAAQSFNTVKMVHSSNFARRGLSLLLPMHAAARATEGGRGASLEESHVMETLQQFLKAFDAKNSAVMSAFTQAAQGTSVQVTIKHTMEDGSIINMPCVIEPIGQNKFKFVVKTIMNKPNFKTAQNDIVIVV